MNAVTHFIYVHKGGHKRSLKTQVPEKNFSTIYAQREAN